MLLEIKGKAVNTIPLLNITRLEKDRQTAKSEADDMKASVDHITKEKVTGFVHTPNRMLSTAFDYIEYCMFACK